MSERGNRAGSFKTGLFFIAVLVATQLMRPVTVATAADIYSLTSKITGSGSINNVQQDSPAFSCASPSTNCSVTSAAGTSFALHATPSALFDFIGWSGAGCSTGTCQLALSGNTTVTATFITQPLLQLVGSTTPYLTFPNAYGDASNGSEIRSRDAIINGDIHLNRGISVSLRGGYADGFTTVQGFTEIQGKLLIRQGRLNVSHVKMGLPAIADFTLAPPSAVTVAQGRSGTCTINTTSAGGFNAAVALTASAVPTGTTATFNPALIAAPGSGSATLTLTAGPATPAGTYTIGITGTGGGTTHNTAVLFTVTAGSANTATLFSDGFEAGGWLAARIQGTDSLWTMGGAGTQPVTLPHGGAMLADFNSYTATTGSQTRLYRPSGIAIPGTVASATLSFWMYHDTAWSSLNDQVQVQVSTNGTSWTNVGAPANRSDGTTGWAEVEIDLSGYKGQTLWLGFVGTSAYGMDIYLDDVAVTTKGAAGADFTLSAPSSVSAAQGGSGTATITTTVTGGFNAAVALIASGVPTGATAAFSPIAISAPGNGNSTLKLSAGASTPTGSYLVTVTGTGAGQAHAATILFTVTAPKVLSFSGTVAMGAAGQDAEISLRDLEGEIVSTISDAMGGWLVPFSSFKKVLTPPFIVRARFTVAGRVVNLFSMSTDDAGGNIKMNITPVTDMITRAYEPLYSTNPDTVEGLPNDPGKLAQIIGGARIVLGELLPPAIRNSADFIRDSFEPDPLKSDYDAMLERIKIGYHDGNVTVADVTGKPMATTSFAKLSSNTVGTGDEETVTKAEADAAIAKVGAFPETTPPYVNEAASGSIPPVPAVTLPAPTNFTATKTGEYTWKLTWNPVAGAIQYFVYQRKGSAPSVATGLYDQSSTSPPFIVASGNSTSAHNQVDTEGTYYWVLAAIGTDGTKNEIGLPAGFVGVPTAAVSLSFARATTCVTRWPLGYAYEKFCYYLDSQGREMKHGVYEQFDSEADQLIKQMTYVDNILNGPARYYDYDQMVPVIPKFYRLKAEGNYLNGSETGVWRYYHADSYNVGVESLGKLSGEATFAFIPAYGTTVATVQKYYCPYDASVLPARRGLLNITETIDLTTGRYTTQYTWGPNGGCYW